MPGLRAQDKPARVPKKLTNDEEYPKEECRSQVRQNSRLHSTDGTTMYTYSSSFFFSSHLSLKKRHTLNGFHFSVRSGKNDGSWPFSSHAVASVGRLLEHGRDFVDGAALRFRNLLPREQDEQGEKDDEDQEHVGADNLKRERKKRDMKQRENIGLSVWELRSNRYKKYYYIMT